MGKRKTPRALRTSLDTNLDVFRNAKNNPWLRVDSDEDYLSTAELDNSEFRIRVFQEWEAITLEIAFSKSFVRWAVTPHVQTSFNKELITQTEVKVLAQIFKCMRTFQLTTIHIWNPWTLTLDPLKED